MRMDQPQSGTGGANDDGIKDPESRFALVAVLIGSEIICA